MFSFQQIGLIKLHIDQIELNQKDSAFKNGNNICCYVKVNEKLYDIIIFNSHETIISNLVVKKNDSIIIDFKNIKNKAEEYGKITIGINRFPEQTKYNFTDWIYFDNKGPDFATNKAYINLEIEWVNSLQEVKAKNQEITNISIQNNKIDTNKNKLIDYKDDFLFKIQKFEDNLKRFAKEIDLSEVNEDFFSNIKNIKTQFQTLFEEADKSCLEYDKKNRLNETKNKIQNLYKNLKKNLYLKRILEIEQKVDQKSISFQKNEQIETTKKSQILKKHPSEMNFDKIISKMDKEINILSKITESSSKPIESLVWHYDQVLHSNKNTIQQLENEINLLRNENEKLKQQNKQLIEQVQDDNKIKNKNNQQKKSIEITSNESNDFETIFNITNLMVNNPGTITSLIQDLKQKLKRDDSKKISDLLEKINLKFYEMKELLNKKNKENEKEQIKKNYNRLSNSSQKNKNENYSILTTNNSKTSDKIEKTKNEILEENYDNNLQSIARNLNPFLLKEKLQNRKSSSDLKLSERKELKILEESNSTNIPSPIFGTKSEDIDELISDFKKNHPVDIDIVKLNDGQYQFGNKKVILKILNGKLVIRVGGGFLQIKDFLNLYQTKDIKKRDLSKSFDKNYFKEFSPLNKKKSKIHN